MTIITSFYLRVCIQWCYTPNHHNDGGIYVHFLTQVQGNTEIHSAVTHYGSSVTCSTNLLLDAEVFLCLKTFCLPVRVKKYC